MCLSNIDTLTFFVRSSLRNKVDGTDPMTVRAVMSMENFSDVVKNVSTQIFKGACHNNLQVFGLACTTGYHRADVTGRVTTAVTNSILSDAGERCLNVLHMALCKECSCDLHHSMQVAKMWLQHPWTLMEPNFPSPPVTRPEAWHNYQACLDSR